MAQVSLLNNLDAFSIVHSLTDAQSTPQWEPFEFAKCGAMSNKNLELIFEEIFSGHTVDLHKVNAAYQQTSCQKIASIDASKSIGFKMRLHPPSRVLATTMQTSPRWAQYFQRQYNDYLLRDMKRRLFRIFRAYGVVVFMAVRQDILRWALSTYHGDGTHSFGHLQGSHDANHEKIYVDVDRLGTFIHRCRYIHKRKKKIVSELHAAGARVEILRYEDFQSDPKAHFRALCDTLDVDVTDADIQLALDTGTRFQKVHADDISTYVENHQDILARFHDCYEPW